MANENRSDRQLMRQRGAGSRNVEKVDFGFKLSAESSRDDRQLMRQRGAGNRQIGNVDFGFSFPTPSSSRKSSRTPQVARRSVERLSKTPASSRTRRSSTVPSARTTTQSNVTVSDRQRLSKTPQPSVQVEQPNSSKRRRLSKDLVSESIQYTVIGIPTRSEQYTAPSDLTSTEEYGSANPLARVDEGNENLDDYPASDPRGTESPLFVPEDGNKENEVDARKQHESASKRIRTRATPSKLSTDNRDHDDPAEDFVAQSIEDPGQTQSEEPDDIDLPGTMNQQESLASALKKRKKKRKSITLPRKKRRSSELTRKSLPHSAIIDSVVETVDEVQSETEKDQSPGSGTPDEETGPEQPSRQSLPLWKKLIAKRAQRRGRMSVSVSPMPHEASEEDEDETYVAEEDSPEPVTPGVKQKTKPRQPRKNSKLRTHDAKVQKKKTSRGQIPVITHRITNTQALPTITEESECVSDEDMEVLPAAFVNRTQPNAVDVLAQLCRETIQSAIRKLETDSTAAKGRAEIQNKRTALEAFGENLDQRLFDMSQAVEHRMTLDARLRKSKREKAELQARWIEVRRQRDELALKADKIRRDNWENEEECKQQWQISELAHKTELELGHGYSDKDDLDFMLKTVAGNVSSQSGRGGILNRVKSFNSRLERIATMLEGR